MSQKKIIFFAILAVIIILLVLGVSILSWQKKKTISASEITLWINEGVSEDYYRLVEGFQKFSPENKKIAIKIEKKPNDQEKYRNILLQTLADQAGPDIFMLQKWEDATLENRVEPIPNTIISIADFENRFDSEIFGGLILTGSDNQKNSQSLMGVPIGYETLGVFYNRVLMRPSVPKLWSELENLYPLFPAGKFPSNLGLSREFVPNISNILPLFFANEKSYSYRAIANSIVPFESYYAYGDMLTGNSETVDTTYVQNSTLRNLKTTMENNKNTTYDEFLRGNIGMIIGYPSLVVELEKAKKRVGSESVHEMILTEKVPQESTKSSQNIAKYSYFALSKNTKNPDAGAAFLQYLTTPDAQRILMEINPHLIPAQKEFHTAAAEISLSPEFPRTKLDAFIPSIGTTVHVFDYGIKNKFDNILYNNWREMWSRAGISTLGKILSSKIQCAIEGQINTETDTPCE